MKDYKEILEKDRIWYWCNSLGEINMPGAKHPFQCFFDLNILPPPAKRLFDKYQGENYGVRVYTVTLDGEFGMLIGALYDYDQIEDGVKSGEISGPFTHAMFHYAVEKVGRRLETWADTYGDHPVFSVLYGEDTDPDGDELLFFIPYNNLLDENGEEYDPNRFQEVVEHIDATVYGDVFTEALNDAIAAVKWFRPEVLEDVASTDDEEEESA